MQRIVYGDHPSQFAELTGPPQNRSAVVVVIHGGFWHERYGLELGRPLALDLVAHGVRALTIEYRRISAGGGWPETGEDVLAALDAVAGPLVTLGHSAGGHLAVWAAARHPRVVGAVSQAGVLDFRGDPQITKRAAELLGGTPEEVPDKYADADPTACLPIDKPMVLVHGENDEDVPISQSEAFATASGAELITLRNTTHMDLITPGTKAWQTCRDAALRLAAEARP
ncbi:alpha/beta hydrolase [Saccharothrix violaceirubra]|uniref:Dipeptidyl aminopeptidase/acylaminoacyl peptidase n=1 Tax=Saccharothrix violaceirubra TaxID=413306 RepID=A0A7W7WYM8_9PSEU|nr:prolyl oligopeptidase family serine peptidase [Saccharothrix violaceirubra]MBB4967878.1 dipeptidyl aminopeptidase/acylaminoacyl peptidase [Saccharothrix violaceirubra]